MRQTQGSDEAAIEEVRRLAEEGGLIGYFGYGSLVNRETLRTRIVAAFPARVSGWRREWQPRPHAGAGGHEADEVALLTARVDAGASIDGLLVYDRAENLPAVDIREADYRRRRLLPDAVALASGDLLNCPLFIYEADPPSAGGAGHPILQSYLDAVLQGFRREHGEAAVSRFIASTANFETPILRDRSAPRYPRSVTLAADEASFFERMLGERGVRYLDP